MLEFETPLDTMLAPSREAGQKIDERTERLARGDFSNPSDRALDVPSVRMSIIRRLIGRAG